MAQGVLGFKYEEEKRDTGMTGLAGLPIYLDLTSVMGLKESIERHLHIKQQSWTDSQTLISLILTNLAGGDCVDDLRKLQGDSGFCKVLRRIEQKGMKRRERLPTLRVNSQRYKLFGLVTNMDWAGGNVDSLAPGALREVGGAALCDEGRFSRWQVSIG